MKTTLSKYLFLTLSIAGATLMAPSAASAWPGRPFLMQRLVERAGVRAAVGPGYAIRLGLPGPLGGTTFRATNGVATHWGFVGPRGRAIVLGKSPAHPLSRVPWGAED
jgi:hypothetical protein